MFKKSLVYVFVGLAVFALLLTSIKATTTPQPAKIAFESTRAGSSTDPVYDDIYLMDPDGSNVTRLTTSNGYDGIPSWSPDGLSIVFESWRDGNPEIYIMENDGNNQTNLTSNSATDKAPAISPDGTKIAFDSNRTGYFEIYTMNLDGTGLTQLTNNGSNFEPAWSPDGSQIVYESSGEIYIMNADGSNPSPLTNSSGRDSWPAWSPDGTKIVFVSNRNGNAEIYVMDSDGTDQTNLSNNSSNDYWPSWSPDGQQIIFETHRDGDYEIYIMNSDGTSLTRLTTNSAYDEAPVWFDPAYMVTPTSTTTSTPTVTPTPTPSPSPLPSGWFGSAVVEYNGKIYSFGGYNSGVLDQVAIYDTTNETWSSGPSMSVGRYELGAVRIGNYAYVIGGYDPANSSMVERYNLSNDTWDTTTIASLNYPRMGFGCVAYGGKIYVIGGYYYGTIYNSVEIYDPDTNVWTMGTSMPTARWRLGAALVNNKIYAIGGSQDNWGGSPASVVEEFDPQANGGLGAWTSKPNIWAANTGFGIAAYNNKIYMIGGGSYASLLEYNPVNGLLLDKGALPDMRFVFTAATSGNYIYAIAGTNNGFGNSFPVNLVEKLDPNYIPPPVHLPPHCYSNGVTECNGKVYSIGGYGDGYYLDVVREYNPATQTWAIKACLPTWSARYEVQAVSVGGKVYAIGGYGIDCPSSSIVQSFDPGTNSWAPCESMNSPRIGCAAAVGADNKIYVFGGYESTFYDTIEVYDPVTNTWDNTKAPMPNARAQCGAVAIGDDIYVFGGNSSGYPIKNVDIYNIRSNTWRTGPDLPSENYGFAIAKIGDLVYLMGGLNGNQVLEFNPNTGNYTVKEEMLSPRFYFGAATVIINNTAKIYAVGGITDYQGLIYAPLMEEYDPSATPSPTPTCTPDHWFGSGVVQYGGKIYSFGGYGSAANLTVEYDPVNQTWTEKANMPSGRCEPAVAVYNGLIYVIGGYDGTYATNVVEVYDPVTDSWNTTPKTPMGVARGAAGAAIVNGKIYVIGGYNGGYIYSGVEEYDIATDQWNSNKAGMPTTARWRVACSAVGNYIYVFGGTTDGGSRVMLTTVEKYDTVNDSWDTNVASMPVVNAGFQAVTVNNDIYLLGRDRYVYKYDTLADTYTSQPDMKAPRQVFGATYYNGNIYMIGGLSGIINSKILEIYTP